MPLFSHRGIRRSGRWHMAAGAAALAAALTSATGCYEYVPAPGGGRGAAPRAGAEVRLELTDAGSAALASQIGPRVESLDGIFEGAGSDSVTVRARRTVMRGGRELDWNNERVAVPVGAVSSLRVRRLSPRRTALAGAALAGGLAGAYILGNRGGFGGGAPPGQPPISQ